MGYTEGKISKNIFVYLYIMLALRVFFFSFLLKLILEEIRLFYLQSQHFTFFQFTRISEPISFRVVEDVFLTQMDRDQFSCTEYYYTCRIFIFCCDSTWPLPCKQPWAFKITLFSERSLGCTYLQIISFRSWHFNSLGLCGMNE